MVSPDQSLDGYLNYTLSYFKTSDFQISSAPKNYSSEEFCRYPDYREPPWSPNKYERSTMYWIILAARLIFVVIFENIVVLVMIVVKWCIPDIPGDLKDRIRREAYITNEIIIKQETIRAQNGHLCMSSLYHFIYIHVFLLFIADSEWPAKKERLRNMEECPATPEQWDRLISKSLSGSEFDLMVHGNEPCCNNCNNVKSPSSV